MANEYYTLKIGQQTVPSQLLYDSPWSITVNGDVEACLYKALFMIIHTEKQNHYRASK